MNYRDRITIESGKRSGKPCIRGMRITVYDILSYLASGMTYQEVLEDFPYLTQEDIFACLSYAADREQQTLLVKAWSFFSIIISLQKVRKHCTDIQDLINTESLGLLTLF